jgi:mono/diheme cytochrome c family protein
MRMLAVAILSAAPLCAQPADYARDIEPIFASRCYGCHGQQQQMNGLRLDLRDAALAGGYSGSVIVPGKSAESKLIRRVTSENPGVRMPPVGAPLTTAQIAALRSWVDGGAIWPAAAKAATREAKPGHWSFQPVTHPVPPQVRRHEWVRNPIDSFVLARLEQESIEPSPEANRATLLRRLSLDLIGLPPEPAEVAEFVSDKRPDWYERAVDRLLASPHFGERWGRYWLDLAHYADSDGYERDPVRPWAWRYRQWVIEALNADMPFDEFTVQQLAGDLLTSPRVDQRIATGFLRNTLTNREAGVDRTEARFEQLVNRTNTVGTTWLGLTVGCSQCHNHKFDPITQKDYYSLFAFFESAEEQNIDAPLPGQRGAWLAAWPEYAEKRNEILNQYCIRDRERQWESRIRDAFLHPGKDIEWDYQLTEFRAGYDGADKVLKTDPEKRSSREENRLTDYFVHSPGPEFDRDKEAAAELKKAREKLTALKDDLPPYTQAPVMAFDPSAPQTHIHIGGDPKNLGVALDPGTPAFLPPLGKAGASRLDLARWLVARDNPLTARVTVNRIWQEMFGTGLVRTSEDFGTQGEKPSHPELLDWLASDFVDNGWSLKSVIRTIATSATYRQASHARKDLDQRDPENRLLARQNRVRLPAELIRDSALAASGLLNPAIGGPSVRPPQPAGIAELGYANSIKWRESKGVDRYRRGMYIHYQRTTPYPLLANFDAPDSNTACSRRRRSDTPLQALNLLNDPVFYEAAAAFADRLQSEAPADPIKYGFLLCLGREPSASERKRLEPLIGDGGQITAMARVLMNLDEFITRE